MRFALTALPFLIGLTMWDAAGASRAGESHSFIVAGNDGYGIEDCLGETGECGRVVADAWCDAHGHGAALAFGRADDVTGVVRAAARSAPSDPYVVTCGD